MHDKRDEACRAYPVLHSALAPHLVADEGVECSRAEHPCRNQLDLARIGDPWEHVLVLTARKHSDNQRTN
jgi:hypothetical protein